MPSSRIVIAAMIAGLSCGTAPAAADQRIAADHNNSSMLVDVAADGVVVITYERPRAGLQAAGIAPGAVLFRGRIEGTRITGEARAFKKGCDAAPYRVQGRLEGDRITLTGPGPVRAGCTVERLDPASPHSTLVFVGRQGAFAALGATPAAAGPSAAPAAPGLRAAIFADPHTFVARSTQVWRELRPEDDVPANQLFLDTCVVLMDGGSIDDIFIERLQMSAFYASSTAKALTKAGYPERVWRPALDRLTKARVDVLVDRRSKRLDLLDENAVRTPVIPQEKQLVAAIEAYRAGQPTLAPVSPLIAQCGGDFIGDVKLATEPAGGVVRVIREFYFKLCTASKIPPYSDQCDQWAVAAADTRVAIGTYYYSARWPDGRAECDRIEINPDNDDLDRVIKIAQSGRACPQ